MKLLVVLVASVAFCAGSVIRPPVNSSDVENGGRYVWIPEGEDGFTLFDTEAPVSEEEMREAERSGNNNQYWLFTRQNQNSQILVHNNIDSVRRSNYMNNRPIMVIVHGFNGNAGNDLNRRIRTEYLAFTDANVISVDWRAAAGGLYNTAVRNVPPVGQALGNFLNWLITNAGGNWNNVHLVGFSLGAHVVGNAGRQVGGRPARVTGLDPAGPLWGGNAGAMNRNDGQYVESIHTDGGRYGIFNPIANADFYPNGGRNPQPGCSGSGCSHERAHELYASTIRNNRFVGRLCADLNQVRNNQCTGISFNMGNAILTKRGNGLYRLNTGASWPF